MVTLSNFVNQSVASLAALSAGAEEYGYLNLSDGGVMSVIIGILIGFFVACCMTLFDRRVLGDFVRHVLRNECLSRETAKTLAELGYEKNAFVRGALRSGVSLRRVVKCVEEEAFNAETARKQAEYEAANEGKKVPAYKPPKFKVDVSTMHFYIPEELKYMADVKFEKKGANPVTLLIALVLFAAVAVIAFYAVPELLQMLDNMLGIFDPNNNVVT